jgi:hypothetical protein
LALALALVLVFGLNRPHRLTDEERGVLRAYEDIRAALSSDDLVAAKVAAVKMAENFRDRSSTAEPAQHLAASATLHQARRAFKVLSEETLPLAYHQSGYYIARCPGQQCMEKCNGCPMSEFSPWVQVSTAIENPFMGRAHPHCGVIAQ